MRYFKLNYKQLLMPTVFLTIVGIGMYLFPLIFENNLSRLNTNLTSLSIFLIGACLLIPIYEFSPLKNKRGADMYYGLPLTKTKLYLKLYLKGLAEVLLAFTIIYVFGVLIVVLRGFPFTVIYYIPLYFLLLIGTGSYYSFNVFLFIKANRTIDGILFMGLYMIMPMFLVYSVTYLFEITSFVWANSSFVPFSPITYTVRVFEGYLINKPILAFSLENDVFRVISTLCWLCINIGLGALGIFYTKHEKPENIQQNSDTWIGYKTLIPTLVFTLLIGMNVSFKSNYTYTYGILVLLAGYIGYVIYERTFKVRWIYLVLITGLALLAFTVGTLL